MEQQIKKILSEVTIETLEKLAFLFVFPDDERVSEGPPPATAGRVAFNGSFSGSLVVRIANLALPEISANMLGMDDDAEISSADQQDAFKEILNVICGNVLPVIAGDQVEFNIMAPEILSERDLEAEVEEGNPLCVVRLMLEDGFCDVSFFAQGRLPDIIEQIEIEQIQ